MYPQKVETQLSRQNQTDARTQSTSRFRQPTSIAAFCAVSSEANGKAAPTTPLHLGRRS